MSYQNCIRSDTIAVNGTPAFFESEDYVHCGDGLSLSVLAVHCGILDDSAEEVVDEVPGFIVDGAADALDAASSCESADAAAGETGPLNLLDFGSLH